MLTAACESFFNTCIPCCFPLPPCQLSISFRLSPASLPAETFDSRWQTDHIVLSCPCIQLTVIVSGIILSGQRAKVGKVWINYIWSIYRSRRVQSMDMSPRATWAERRGSLDSKLESGMACSVRPTWTNTTSTRQNQPRKRTAGKVRWECACCFKEIELRSFWV